MDLELKLTTTLSKLEHLEQIILYIENLIDNSIVEDLKEDLDSLLIKLRDKKKNLDMLCKYYYDELLELSDFLCSLDLE